MEHYHGHRGRLRARLLDAPEKLADYEVLEILLGYVLIRRDTKPIAKEMLARFASLQGLLAARPHELLEIPGVGESVVSFIALLREFLARHAESPLRHRELLCSPETVAAMARQRLGKYTHEEMWAAFVDNKNRLISWERAAKGTVDCTVIYPRDIMERALTLKATGFFLVHNHPGGDPTPSGADVELTNRIQRASQTLLLRFIDHVIVTEKSCFSMMSDGLL